MSFPSKAAIDEDDEDDEDDEEDDDDDDKAVKGREGPSIASSSGRLSRLSLLVSEDTTTGHDESCFPPASRNMKTLLKSNEAFEELNERRLLVFSSQGICIERWGGVESSESSGSGGGKTVFSK